MLDQNTDRMWYVIGAVIIGAAIIFIMNNTFPQLFASIGDTFKSKTNETTVIVDGIYPTKNLISYDTLELYNSEKATYDEASSTWTLNVRPLAAASNWWNSGLMVKAKTIVVPYGSTLTITYDMYIPEGVTNPFVTGDINNLPDNPSVGYWYGNDNDHRPDRKYIVNGVLTADQKPAALKSGEWNKITFSYSNTSPLNTTASDVYDFSRLGFNNVTDAPIEISIRNIHGSLSN